MRCARLLIAFITAGYFIGVLSAQAMAVWSIADRKLDVPTRGVSLKWRPPAESDVSSIMIYRRAMDHRINPDLSNPENLWKPRVRLMPNAMVWRDDSTQVSVSYQYKIIFINSSGYESDPVIINVLVPNEKTPTAPQGFSINGFDPMPPE